MTINEYIKLFDRVAQTVSSETGIPADAMLAQAALETGWGTHVKGNNYFGIKATKYGRKILIRTAEIHSDKNKNYQVIHSITPVTINGKQMFKYDVDDWFFIYDNPIDSFRGYADFIKSNKRYAKALQQMTDTDYLRKVAEAGYATDPEYNVKLQSILKKIKEWKQSQSQQ